MLAESLVSENPETNRQRWTPFYPTFQKQKKKYAAQFYFSTG